LPQQVLNQMQICRTLLPESASYASKSASIAAAVRSVACFGLQLPTFSHAVGALNVHFCLGTRRADIGLQLFAFVGPHHLLPIPGTFWD